MAGGWTKDGDIQQQIEDTVEDELLRVRSQLPEGESLRHCEECEAEIPQARREAVPGVRLCVPCQSERDAEQRPHSYFNRRGSKDSQLR
ncbi:hypothetical protein AN478_06015 [Thiohalorhabdus denitrificans]|uniref:Transcriptional regulator, TraR/DksA family n=1 Tax=Thiohalorhabdus denitrificans TaxID=381306 RepID=A0A0P9CNL9_9GAMM|nr:DksA/TraR family C4-type zinc finger protein [Thiohalorhabdus denitrificans]KPV40710.1 hypothetical protein AN478_06015 [Thiohalorhabdus denitrificans]SCY46352.1 transcriptional regulator, TraR/DksA family [Thiohalorhabdus denitrificans]